MSGMLLHAGSTTVHAVATAIRKPELECSAQTARDIAAAAAAAAVIVVVAAVVAVVVGRGLQTECTSAQLDTTMLADPAGCALTGVGQHTRLVAYRTLAAASPRSQSHFVGSRPHSWETRSTG